MSDDLATFRMTPAGLEDAYAFGVTLFGRLMNYNFLPELSNNLELTE